jgi:hypothetical protein
MSCDSSYFDCTDNCFTYKINVLGSGRLVYFCSNRKKNKI